MSRRSRRKVEDAVEVSPKRLQHGRETDSAVAGRLLADWDAAAAAFVKVMPTDFKRVLEAAAAARAEGRDETEAVMAAARA